MLTTATTETEIPSFAITAQQRAEQILNAIIVQTGQAEYDDVFVEQLISEYESLVC